MASAPDPSETTSSTSRRRRRIPPPPLGKSRTIDPARLASLRAMAANPTWEQFKDDAGTAPAPHEVLGAADMMGENPIKVAGKLIDPRLIFNELMTRGAGTVISIPGGAVGETFQITLGDYYQGVSDYYLQEEGFYEGRGYRYNFDPTRGGIDADALPTTAAISSVGKWAADLTLVPTSTTNPNRPRTVAAGWDGYRKVLTVVFRDGTFYNYYGVDSFTWGNFAKAISKGEYIYTYLEAKVRGKADMSSAPQSYQELLYKVAKTAQAMQGGVQETQSAKSARRTQRQKFRYGSQNTVERSNRKMRAAAERYFGSIASS